MLRNKAMFVTVIAAAMGGHTELLGDEKVINGDFSSAVGWTTQSGWAVDSGVLRRSAVAGADMSYRNIGAESGKQYRVTFDLLNWTVGTVRIYAGFGATPGDAVSGNGHYSQIVIGGNLDTYIYIEPNNGVSNYDVDNISIKEILNP